MSASAGPDSAVPSAIRDPVASDPVLALAGVYKRFGGVHALRGAEFSVSRRGVIHGLIGENGSGKSTLLGVISGQLRPDAGRMFVEGSESVFASPVEALAAGIAMVAQETALAPDLTIAENIFLGRRMARSRVGVDWAETRRRAVEVLERLELSYDPSWPVHRLRPDQQQMVEIARALSIGPRLLILDEPTSSLTDDEVEALFSAVRLLRSQSVSTVFVSHRMNEMFDLVDELTVLRDGVTAAAGPVSDFTSESVVAAMVGGATALKQRHTAARVEVSGDRRPVLEVKGLSSPGTFTRVDLAVAPGEIVGLAGLVGAGRSELLEAIFGVRTVTEGEATIDGASCRALSPRQAIDRRVAFLPPDRKNQGLILKRTIDENMTMVATLDRSRLGIPGGSEIEDKVRGVTGTMRLRAASHRSLVGTLSGGNQQKVALGKWLAADPRVMLLDEPTRGVDVAAKAEIHDLLREVASRGVGLLVSSSENSELLDLCDRIVVMFRGRAVASLQSDLATEAALARYAGGHDER